eukprot:TRINITY_DN13250_c0_g1_i1.p1 TRINITY_DN13250_c0_g1~~TRINITY_DN13250_c0_g1_i1.p1  ORF type:complete len:344 (+),score=67.71 TRINITY_DN13250_c0_g1_i1:219-1250(+)
MEKFMNSLTTSCWPLVRNKLNSAQGEERRKVVAAICLQADVLVSRARGNISQFCPSNTNFLAINSLWNELSNIECLFSLGDFFSVEKRNDNDQLYTQLEEKLISYLSHVSAMVSGRKLRESEKNIEWINGVISSGRGLKPNAFQIIEARVKVIEESLTQMWNEIFTVKSPVPSPVAIDFYYEQCLDNLERREKFEEMIEAYCDIHKNLIKDADARDKEDLFGAYKAWVEDLRPELRKKAEVHYKKFMKEEERKRSFSNSSENTKPEEDDLEMAIRLSLLDAKNEYQPTDEEDVQKAIMLSITGDAVSRLVECFRCTSEEAVLALRGRSYKEATDYLCMYLYGT